MRLFLTVFITLCVSVSVQAQLFENFETGEKGAYGAGTVQLSTGNWFMSEALIGNLAADQFNGTRSVRMANEGASIQMQFNTSGAGQVSFYYGTYTTDANNNRHSTIQLQQSTNNGTTWTNVGSPLQTSAVFRQAIFDVDTASNIRFRIIQTSGGTPGGTRNHRVNIDDFRVTAFAVTPDNPQISLEVANEEVQTSSSLTYAYPSTLVGSNRTLTVKLTNTGSVALEVQPGLSGSGAFTYSGEQDYSLGFRESGTITVTFQPSAAGVVNAALILETNDPDFPSININLSGEGIAAGQIIPIADARALPFGSIVTVAGHVNTANEFGGPIYIQDNTAGIAVFYEPIHTAVQRGDSVVVTGPIGEFNPISGPQGTFLRQITGSDIQFTVYPEGFRLVEPRLATLSQINAGCCESQLVRIENINFNTTGSFPANTRNYTITQGTSQAEIRIDTRSNFAGAAIPQGPTNVLGVIDRFNAIYQIKPRDLDDIGVEEFVIPGSDIPKSRTFDIATWNVEWFGSAGNGPTDTELQFENVKRVIETMDMDIYALQEISSVPQFERLVAALEGYGGFMANYSQAQRVAYLYKRATVDSVSSGFVATSGNWANGRFPFMFEFDVTIESETRRIRAVNFHAKAFAELSDYNTRVSDANILKQYADSRNPTDRLILLGDYNDGILVSTYNNQPSPYKIFDDDPRYNIVTKSLEERGLTSYRSISMIDHIMINEKLFDYHIQSTEQIENVGYIGSYLSTTSAHYPVWTRFAFSDLTSTAPIESEFPQTYILSQNYPNPFNPTTVIRYELPQNSEVTLQVFDMLGRQVATLANGSMPAGTHEVQFDATGLSSGVYLYRLQTSSGVTITNKMMLVK